jgi:hypothetical protein
MITQSQRARAYLAKLPHAIAGQSGHNATFQAACRLVEFGLSFEQAWLVLCEWNQTHCAPQWSERELEHKLKDAFQRAKPKPEFFGRGNSLVSHSAPVQRPQSPTVRSPTVRPRLSRLIMSGYSEDIEKVASLRRLSIESVHLAHQRGFLWGGLYRSKPAWVITDKARRLAQYRRLDGKDWSAGVKALNHGGSNASWPLGIREAERFDSIALCEGGPDLLAAFHFLRIAGKLSTCAPVAVLGADLRIDSHALRCFFRRRVRLFCHEDKAGARAAKCWSEQLNSVQARVDRFSFAPFRKSDGTPVNDLNDLVHVPGFNPSELFP